MSFATKYDLASNLSDAFYEALQSKKWSDRKEALDGVVEALNKHPSITLNDSNFSTLINALSQVCKSL